ncbi:ABC transporter permease [Dethiobacter alkaliphilus]|uniref:Binding-protein-dependent transport systems inner membrane component n=1 Tax=Dethiobacter alkaliphilus AHT 1 TaxID=555088 RepID=C0GIW9_DETAL|nr:ABC transporter permease [Dethiobacter alkaliphilus]EEG76783.1 binding-protein-dependent transport systems inner membrane component [Dethiobacter alkaliphilus AHT 1]
MSERSSDSFVSPEHKEYLRRQRIYRLQIFAVQILLLLGFIALWEVAATQRWIDPFITSQPSRVMRTLVSLHNEGNLYMHTGITVFETVVGFTLGTVIGTVIAVILWWSKFISAVLDPYLVVLNSLPKIALGPIIIVWAGQGMTAIIAMALLISVVVTILGVYSGFSQVDANKIKLLQSFGASRWQILKKVILPASVPTIISALKINVGLSWVGVIVGEFLVSRAGLGYLIVYGGQVFRLDLVMTGVIILSVAAAVMYQGVVLLEKFAMKWR